MSGIVVDRVYGNTEWRLMDGDTAVGVVLRNRADASWDAFLTATPRLHWSEGHRTPQDAALWIGEALEKRVEGLR